MPGHVVAEHGDFEPPGGYRAWIIWFLGATFYLYEFLLRNMSSVMESLLQTEFHTDATTLGAAIGAYDYVYAPMQIVVGLLLDRFGAKRLLTIACAMCAAGTFFFAYASNLEMIAIGRVLMGFGSSFAFVGSLYQATVWFPARQIALLAGCTTALGMVGEMFESPLSKAVNTYGWRDSSIFLAWTGVVLCAIIWFGIPKNPPWIEQIIGNQTTTEGNALKKLWQRLVCVIGNPQVWLIAFVGMTLYVPLSAFGVMWGTSYVEALTGASTAYATFLVGLIFIGWGAFGPVCGWISDHWASRKMPQVLGSLLLLICSVIFLSLSSAPTWVAFILLLGMGLGSSPQVAGFAAAIEVSPKFARGTAAALVNFVTMAFEGFYQPLIGGMLDWAHEGQTAAGEAAVYTVQDFRFAFSWMPVLLILGFIATLFMRESHAARRKKPVEAKEPEVAKA